MAEAKAELEPPLDCLPERHRIFSDADERSPSGARGRSPGAGAPGRPRPREHRGRRPPDGPGRAPAPPPEGPDAAAAPAAPAGRGRGPAPAAYAALGLAVLGVWLAAGAARGPAEGAASPAEDMVAHSAKHLNLTKGVNKATIGVLQEKLQLTQMQVDLDTQVFMAKREAAHDLVKSMCNLPEKVCRSMAAAVGTKDMKFHKKSSVPLDSNKGSYFGVWMWVKEMGGEGHIQVAFKAASLSYQLRDVVTYRDQIDDEPVIKCETLTNNLWFIRGTAEHCREVARRRTITPLPVFQQSVMSSEEMQLVDTLMESMLAKKVLEDANVDIPQLLRAGSSTRLALEGER